VLAAGAADGDRHVALALPLEALRGAEQQRRVRLDELLRAVLREDVLRDVGVGAGVLAQGRDPVRVGKESYVSDVVGVARDAVLEPERHAGELEARRGRGEERVLDAGAQLVLVQVRGVEQGVGRSAGRFEEAALGGDAVGEHAVALERVGAADLLEAADDHVVVGVDEHQVGFEAALAEVLDDAHEVGHERARAHVEDHRGPADLLAAGGGQLGGLADERLREVVDDVVADVLQCARHGRAPAARDAGDDDQVQFAAVARTRMHCCHTHKSSIPEFRSNRRGDTAPARSPNRQSYSYQSSLKNRCRRDYADVSARPRRVSARYRARPPNRTVRLRGCVSRTRTP
jgi:hypothetical protein